MKLAKSTTFNPEKTFSVAIMLSFTQRPANFDARFSRNADVPSFLSSVAAQIPKN